MIDVFDFGDGVTQRQLQLVPYIRIIIGVKHLTLVRTGLSSILGEGFIEKQLSLTWLIKRLRSRTSGS